jgi:hypothetical protein
MIKNDLMFTSNILHLNQYFWYKGFNLREASLGFYSSFNMIIMATTEEIFSSSVGNVSL